MPPPTEPTSSSPAAPTRSAPPVPGKAGALVRHQRPQDLPLPVYGDGRQIRNWLHAEDHAAAIDLVLRRGASGQAYNVAADNERENLEVVHAILDRLGKPRSLIRHVEDRPGHDRRYAIDATRIPDELGWRPRRGLAADAATTRSTGTLPIRDGGKRSGSATRDSRSSTTGNTATAWQS